MRVLGPGYHPRLGRAMPEALEETGGRRRDGRFGAAVFALCGALAVAMTWPLARAPQAQLHGNADVRGNAWAVSWVARQVVRDPLHLFDSNMYFPHTKSLAYALQYTSMEKTLSDKEIDKAHERIEGRLRHVLQAKIRGKDGG